MPTKLHELSRAILFFLCGTSSYAGFSLLFLINCTTYRSVRRHRMGVTRLSTVVFILSLLMDGNNHRCTKGVALLTLSVTKDDKLYDW